ncbi:hypothetical protein C8Q80DRAFT_272815 [Daedaleopsis nitida]|nr:hypothetical protein C8Q80DRAFT_272815 [Daedaleopsis nitida]
MIEEERIMSSMDLEGSDYGGRRRVQHAAGTTSTIGGENESHTTVVSKHSEGAAEPPCLCWNDLDSSRSKPTQFRKPISLHFVYPAIRSISLISARHLNDFIKLCRLQILARAISSETRPDHQFRQVVATYRTTIITDIEEAITSLRTTPGYVCRTDSKPHAERLAERESGLRQFEDSLSGDLEETASLFSVREELSWFESRMQRHKLIQMAIRAVSIATVPYSPLASALIAAADLFGISANHAVEEFLTSDAAERLRYNVRRLENIRTVLQENLAKVKRLRDHLEALKVKIERAQRQPLAARLSDILDTLYAAKFAVDGALSPQCERCESQSAPVPMRKVVQAYKDLAEALEELSMFSGPLANMSDAQCEELDGLLTLCRTIPSPDPTVEPELTTSIMAM